MNALATCWRRIEALLPEGHLGPPVPDEDLAALEQAWGQIPAGYTASTKIHDGFSEPALGFTFPPVREVIALYARQAQLPHWSDRWLPIASDGAGNFLFVDYDTQAVVEFDHEAGMDALCDTVEDFLRWLAFVLERDRPQLDADGDPVDGEGDPWEPSPRDDPEPGQRQVLTWRAQAAADDPGALDAFEKTFVTPDGPAFNRVRVPGEPTRRDWDRLLNWGLRTGHAAAQIDATHGAIQAGRFAPTRETTEASLARDPNHPVFVYMRGLVHFFEGAHAQAAATMDSVLTDHDSVGARSVRGLCRAALGQRAEAIADLDQALGRGYALGGQFVARDKLAELLAQ